MKLKILFFCIATALLSAGCTSSNDTKGGTAILNLLMGYIANNPTHTVLYDGNGNTSGAVPVDNTNYKDGREATILGNTGNLQKSGFNFIGWNTLADGSGTNYQQGQTFTMGTLDVTLYARWTTNPIYTVTYSCNGCSGGTVPAGTANYEQGQNVTVLGNAENLRKDHFTFAVWNTLADGNGTSYAPGQTFNMGTSNITLYAKWVTFDFVYDFGTYPGSYNNIYVIWAENSDETFYYPIYVCNRLLGIGGALTNTALPFWKINKYPRMSKTDIDAVTGATQQLKDFIVPFNLPAGAPRQFTIYFETDVSYNPNDWFTSDQPAILYSVDFDLDNLQSQYTLSFIGWTPNEGTAGIISGADLGELQSELRYITNFKSGSGFGGLDSRSETNLVGGAVIDVKQ